jgi:uncharacterized membrane protein (DUF485 family)
MAGFDHGPANDAEPEDAVASARNARSGLLLFAIYFAFYAAFVAINAFWPDVMSRSVAGVPLAVSYGMALIGGAILLSLVYTWLCRSRIAESEPSENECWGQNSGPAQSVRPGHPMPRAEDSAQ